ncbi:MAG: toll/interleukin-1 receptor domain-containing protein [Xanthomonadales bacterium]|jgi:tetratricopeptide (TPR) repeat protein|nr:toll/interleukin-1 receptor domain-containing protein [Xanthomonadales bacterium]
MTDATETPDANSADQAGVRYEAFISYSHADKPTARWLQNALERYRLPRALRRGPGAAGRKLRPLFRDDTELASSSDLTASIVSALEQSGALVVVCSPRAAASRWANEEIRRFRRVAPGRPILPLIIDGSPDPEAGDCAFPEALLRDEQGNPLPEPLAADLRPEADGKRGALIKLIAGLLGVGVDALRQRDQQRRLRVMTGVTAGALAVSVVTIALAVIADRARDEAELRRDQAESLIEFMLVELRGKLQPIGRLDVLDAVGDEATEYFSALGDLGTDSEVLKRALALRQIGEVRFAEKDFDAAFLAFDQSRQLTRTLHERDPSDNDVLFELSQAEFWVGYVDWQRGDLDGADRAFRRYAGHGKALFEREPDNPGYQLEVAYGAGNLAALARARGDIDEALRYNEEAIQINELLLAENPEDDQLRGELSQSLSWAGSIQGDRGELDASETAFRKAVDGLQQLHASGRDKNDSYELVNNLSLLSSALLRRGKLREALEFVRRCGKEAKALVNHDPQNIEWRRALIGCELGLSRLHRHLGDAATAAQWLASAESNLEQAPPDALGSSRLTTMLVQAEYLLSRGDAAASIDAARAVLSLGNRIRDGADLFRGGVPELQILSLRLIGDAHDALGQASRAGDAWDEARDLLITADSSAPDYRALLAGLHHRLGDTDARDALVVELDAMGYAHPRYRSNF